jgi:hypothetical protein
MQTDLDVGSLPPSLPERARVPREFGYAKTQVLRPLHDVNQRCIELLVKAACTDGSDLPLVRQFGSILRRLTADAQERAALKAFLLVDMEFANSSWWQLIKNQPARPLPPPQTCYFSRAHAVQLARATLTLTWHSVRANGSEACLLGVHPVVAELIGTFSLTEIERIVERQYRHVRPRWEDRPSVWQQLLESACSPDIRLMREFSLRGLQLIAGELI